MGAILVKLVSFAVVMVSNSGADGKRWWWFFGSAAQIGVDLKPLNARVVDLERYSFNGQTNYAAPVPRSSARQSGQHWRPGPPAGSGS